MAETTEPLVLDIAPLPREKIGPFLILGVDKDADVQEIEAHWAQRLIWARNKQIRTPLEDVNWAKEQLLDRDKRVLADVTSMNSDTSAGELKQLLEKHGPLEPETPKWTPLEPPMPELPVLAADAMPDAEAIRAAAKLPDVPLVFPAADRILSELTGPSLDPWSIEISNSSPHQAP
jgi:hypothetical protein